MRGARKLVHLGPATLACATGEVQRCALIGDACKRPQAICMLGDRMVLQALGVTGSTTAGART